MINMNDFINQFRNSQFKNMKSTTFEWLIEIFIGDALVESNNVEMNFISAENQLKQLIMQIHNDSRPMKVKMSYPYYKWDGSLMNTNYIEYSNGAMSRA